MAFNVPRDAYSVLLMPARETFTCCTRKASRRDRHLLYDSTLQEATGILAAKFHRCARYFSLHADAHGVHRCLAPGAAVTKKGRIFEDKPGDQ